jgi:hypothetical protein
MLNLADASGDEPESSAREWDVLATLGLLGGFETDSTELCDHRVLAGPVLADLETPDGDSPRCGTPDSSRACHRMAACVPRLETSSRSGTVANRHALPRP